MLGMAAREWVRKARLLSPKFHGDSQVLGHSSSRPLVLVFRLLYVFHQPFLEVLIYNHKRKWDSLVKHWARATLVVFRGY